MSLVLSATNVFASSGLHGLAEALYILFLVLVISLAVSSALFVVLFARFSKKKIKTRAGMAFFLIYSAACLSMLCGLIGAFIEDYLWQGVGEALYFVAFFIGGIYALTLIYKKVKPVIWPGEKRA